SKTPSACAICATVGPPVATPGGGLASTSVGNIAFSYGFFFLRSGFRVLPTLDPTGAWHAGGLVVVSAPRSISWGPVIRRGQSGNRRWASTALLHGWPEDLTARLGDLHMPVARPFGHSTRKDSVGT